MYSLPGFNLKGLVEEEAIAIQAIQKVDGRSTRVQSGV
jgi:hypothetical protein